MIGGLDWLVASSPSHSNERDERCKKYSGPNSQICTHANIERDVNGHWAGCGGRLRTVGEHDFVRRRRSNAQVDLQSTGNHGAQCAGSADLLLQMDLAVAFAFVAAREPTPAHFADERLLAGVGPYVGGQVVTATERPQTYPTLERLLAGVDAHVTGQFVASRKAPVAAFHRALVRSLVVGRLARLGSRRLAGGDHVPRAVVDYWTTAVRRRIRLSHFVISIAAAAAAATGVGSVKWNWHTRR
ncbi:hypothetical protein T01_1724 [Trichinella spiralis]|uniref:Uncharacterized protein n=1 Tax=Trichinella spiralis TaxID=6334 RepID=A0A0V1BUH0_TRISP|nr:hypothetical protein T01_1724 [Trichinella spiralis]